MARVYIRVARVYIGVARVYIRVARVYIGVARVYIRVDIGVARVYIRVARVYIRVARVYVSCCMCVKLEAWNCGLFRQCFHVIQTSQSPLEFAFFRSSWSSHACVHKSKL